MESNSGRSLRDGLSPSAEPLRVSSAAAASIPSAVSSALLAVLDAVQNYLPPDGISERDCLSRVILAIDNPTINPFIRSILNGDA